MLPLLTVDAPSLLYRAFYALPDSIKGAEGRPVNALLGATNLLLSVVAAETPRALAICFGAEAARYRTEAFPPYHAARPPMPADLAWQWQRAPALWEAFGWTCHASEDLEADDLMASFAAAEAQAGGRALILTGDRDMYQCASDAVTVLYVRTGGKGPERVGPAEVRERYGVDPGQVPDFIALRGDPSDGIPGARGVGPKTAADLLSRHRGLEEVLAASEKLAPVADQLRMFKDIATVRLPAVELPATAPTDLAAGAAAAGALGMNRLAERLGATA